MSAELDTFEATNNIFAKYIYMHFYSIYHICQFDIFYKLSVHAIHIYVTIGQCCLFVMDHSGRVSVFSVLWATVGGLRLPGYLPRVVTGDCRRTGGGVLR